MPRFRRHPSRPVPAPRPARSRALGALRRVAAALAGIALIAILLVGCQQLRMSGGAALRARPAEAFRLATYNVHYILLNRSEGRWSRDGWDRRKGPLDAAFKALDADIVAFQEMESFAGGNDDSVNLTRAWLLRRNTDYAAAAIGDWRVFPSTQPILYRRERFALLDQGWFFFSETPDAIYSRTFDGSYPALASWALLQERSSGRRMRVVNVHFDYASGENRRRSALLVADRLGLWIAAGETVFLLGDLNARAGSETFDILRSAGLDFLPVRGATYHFDRGLNLFGAIDHIAHAGPVEVMGSPMVVRHRFEGAWPTDHYPVVADFAWTSAVQR